MTRHRVFRNLHTAVLLLAAAVAAVAVAVLWWANRTGLPDDWRASVEQEVEKHGAHVRFGALRYIPFRGIIAEDVRVFTDASRLRELSRIERAVLVVDKTQLARGKFRLTNIQLSDVRMSWPVNSEDPDSESLEITNAHATVSMPGGRLLEVRRARGMVAGIQVSLEARMLGYQPTEGGRKGDPDEGTRRQFLTGLVEQLKPWKFDEETPPLLRIFVEGDLSDRSSLRARMSLTAHAVEKNGHVLDEVHAEGEFNANLLTIRSLKATDSRGDFDGRLDYDLKQREGRFDVISSLEVPQLLQSWTGLPPIPHISFHGRQDMEAEGEFRLPENLPPQVRVTGHARCEAVMLRGVSFDAVEGLFAWNHGSLYLRDLKVERPDGEASGKVLVQWPKVRLDLHSTFPVAVYPPFCEGKPLAIVLGHVEELADPSVEVSLQGGFDASDRTSWHYTGTGRLQNLSYREVPIAEAHCDFALNHGALDFRDGEIQFRYEDYALRKAHGGPVRGNARVGSIRYDNGTKTVAVKSVEGTHWPAPLVRMFAPKIADLLEAYRFHSPPHLAASGLVDVTPQGRTDLQVSFRSESDADYRFLGKDLVLRKPGGEVRILHDQVTVDRLRLSTFDGPVQARFVHTNSNKQLEGEVSWENLAMPEIASTYQFSMKGGGAITGRLGFRMNHGKVNTLRGDGHVSLEQAELFAVPMLGPLSPLVASVLGDRRSGYERAKDAFCSFVITDGIVSTSDFRTTTSSLVFTGDGQLDLAQQTVDITLRMNTRGFLNLITLPLRPFYGLFQFRGHGPIAKTEWENVRFTSPPETQQDALMNPPKATVVEE